MAPTTGSPTQVPPVSTTVEILIPNIDSSEVECEEIPAEIITKQTLDSLKNLTILIGQEYNFIKGESDRRILGSAPSPASSPPSLSSEPTSEPVP